MTILIARRGARYGGNNRCFSSRLLKLAQDQQRHVHTLAERFLQSSSPTGVTTEVVADTEVVDMYKWKKLDSRTLGIVHGVIPHGPWTVMKILRSQGFDAYLVGGCVRDLLLKKTPKDFDVITTANLGQIQKQFRRAVVVGQRFPICMVHIQDSVTEVSSFETVAKQTERKEEVDVSQAPQGCKTEDFIRWKNSLKRDFTINSLFLDPFSNKVYDYSRGMSDLKSLKLRTIIPAEESFEEDCARILRGLRIAARLGLSFSKDTEAALHKLSQSVTNLPKARIFMELNYMLSYGAAEPSLLLLQRFSLLEILLPFHAAYLAKQPKLENTSMLMKLLSNLDKVVQCDHPSDCRLWVGILAFHLALVNKPQDGFVAVTLASILYHGEWEEGIKYARENAEVQVHFKPEISTSFISKSDKELAKDVSQLAASVQVSVDVLTESECLQESMSRYASSSCFDKVFIPKRVGRDIAEIFEMLVKRKSALQKRRESYDINYHLLGKGFMWETRFVLGKIILETMGCFTSQQSRAIIVEKNNIDIEVTDQNGKYELPSLLREQFGLFQKSDKKRNLDTAPKDGGVVEVKIQQEIDEIDESTGLVLMMKNLLETRKLMEVSEKESDRIEKLHDNGVRSSVDRGRETLDEEIIEEKKEITKKKKLKSNDKKRSRDERHDAPDEELEEKKKAGITRKQRGKTESSPIDDEFELLGEVVMEDKKKKRKSKSNSEGLESLSAKITKKKNGEPKKKPRQRKYFKPLEDDVAVGKKESTKGEDVNTQSVAGGDKGVAGKTTDKVETEQTAENQNRSRTLLSSLFA